MKVGFRQVEIFIMQMAIVLTILSFSPEAFIANTCSIVMFLFWGGVLVFKFLDRTMRIDFFAKMLIAVYVIWFLCTKLFFGLGIYPSGGLGVVTFLPYCAAFYIIGSNFSGEEKDVSAIITAFFIGQALLTITLLPYLSEISEARYSFAAKNQMGQMLGAGTLFGFFVLFRHYQNIVSKILVLIFSSVSLMSLLVVGSRTPLVGIAVVVIVSFVTKKDKKKSDYAFMATIVVAIAVTIHFLGGLDYVLELFDLADTSEGIDLNNMTSGRLGLYEQSFIEIIQNPIVGLGAYAYVDNFIINTLRCGGILLAVMILPIAYVKMFNVYKKANALNKDSENELLVTVAKSLILFYFVVSLMEGYPPMGPGTSVFLYWMMLGAIEKRSDEINATE